MATQQYSSSEEWKAYEIFSIIKKYYSEVKGNQTLNFPEDFLNELNFEIVNRKDIDMQKRNLIIIANTYTPIDLTLLHSYLRRQE